MQPTLPPASGRNPYFTAIVMAPLAGLMLLKGLQLFDVFNGPGVMFPMAKGIAVGFIALPLLGFVAWKSLAANPAEADNPAAKQFSILDIFLLTSVLALEIAAFWQKNMLLSCLFLSVSVSVLALNWKRLLLRRALLISMAGIMVLSFVIAAVMHRSK